MLKKFWNKSHINLPPPPKKKKKTNDLFLEGATFMILERYNGRIWTQFF